MSSESNFAWRLARFYLANGLLLHPREDRIAWLHKIRVVALAKMDADRKAHKAECEACQNGDFCFEAMTCNNPVAKERLDQIHLMTVFINAERHDEEYARKARGHAVVYEHHIDGFCAYWQNIRHRLFAAVNYRCQRCGEQKSLQAHHRHYDTLGFEELGDLEALCDSCHQRADRQREYDSGLATYASKKYGDYWEERFSYDELEHEFDEWLERKREQEWPPTSSRSTLRR